MGARSMFLYIVLGILLCRCKAYTSCILFTLHNLVLNRELYSSTVLHKYLSRSLNIPLKNDRLMPIQESQYVLTLDYTLKMLNIHERYECGIPVIIEGETGVGKTALVEMLSKLWNYSWVAQWEIYKDRIVDSMTKRLGGRYIILDKL